MSVKDRVEKRKEEGEVAPDINDTIKDEQDALSQEEAKRQEEEVAPAADPDPEPTTPTDETPADPEPTDPDDDPDPVITDEDKEPKDKIPGSRLQKILENRQKKKEVSDVDKLADIIAKQNQPAPVTTEPEADEVPDMFLDPEGFNAYTKQQNADAVAKAIKEAIAPMQKNQQEMQIQNAITGWGNEKAKAADKDPAMKGVYDFVDGAIAEDLLARNPNANIDYEGLRLAVDMKQMEMAAQARGLGLSPANFMKMWAAEKGYVSGAAPVVDDPTPNDPTPKKELTLSEKRQLKQRTTTLAGKTSKFDGDGKVTDKSLNKMTGRQKAEALALDKKMIKNVIKNKYAKK